MSLRYQGRTAVRLVCNSGKTPSQTKHTVGSGRRDRPHSIKADRARWLFFWSGDFFGIPDVDSDSFLSFPFSFCRFLCS